MITKWDYLCDRKLFRITKFINGPLAWRQIGFIGDSPDELHLGLFSDADFAGDKASMRSTSGVLLALYGPHSFFPLGAQSKKQTVVSHSTVEAEIVAADHAIWTSGLPALEFLGQDPQSTKCPTGLPRQPGHGPHHEYWSCSYFTTL